MNYKDIQNKFEKIKLDNSIFNIYIERFELYKIENEELTFRKTLCKSLDIDCFRIIKELLKALDINDYDMSCDFSCDDMNLIVYCNIGDDI